MKAIVLAGGKGTRLAPYTHILPKPLMPIDDMPILEVLLRQMKRAGVNHVVLTVGHLSSLLRAYFGTGEQWGLDISYSYEDKPLGTAGPIALVQGLDKTFLVTNGDVLTTLNLKKLIAFHKQKGGIATIAAHQRQVKIDLGVIQWDGDDRVSGYIEKPHHRLHRQHGHVYLRAARAGLHPGRPVPGFPRPDPEIARQRRKGVRLYFRRLLDGFGPPG